MTNQQVKVNTNELKAALNYIPKSTKNAIGILSAILFDVQKDTLTIKSVTGHSGYIYKIDATANMPFVFCLPANIVNMLLIGAKEEITLVITDTQVKVKGTKLKATLLSDVDCFPTVPSNDGSVSFELEPADTLSLLTFANYVAEPQKGILRGVNLAKEGESVILSATDSFRFIRRQLLTKCELEFNVTLFMEDISCIKAFAEDEYINVSIVTDDEDVATLVFFEQGAITFYTSVLHGNYPQLSRLIDSSKNFIFEAELNGRNVKAVCDAAKQLQAASGDKAQPLVFKADGSNQVFGGMFSPVGEVWLELLETEETLDGNVAAFNLVFFSILSYTNWTMKCGGSTGMSIFNSADGFTTYVLMPVQING